MNETKLVLLMSLIIAAGMVACSDSPASPDVAAERRASMDSGVLATASSSSLKGGRPGSSVVVYVTSQGLYYDSIVGPSLPPHGRFQKLELGPMGLQTEFGPGDPGYLGGRWWMDSNGNNEMDSADNYFSCPLLGPGRD